MASLNSCNFIGNLGRDAELKYTANGLAKSDFSLAVNGRRKTSSGEWEDEVEWVNCVVFGDRAERVSQYLTKGKQVFVSGRLSTRSWSDDQGAKHYRTEVIVNDVQFLDRRDDDGQAAPSGNRSRGSRSSSYDDLDDLPFA